MRARSGELWWRTLIDDSYSSSLKRNQSMWHYRTRYIQRFQSAFQRLVSSISRQCLIRTQRAIFVDFRTEIGRSQSSRFLFLKIARTPHTTQSDLVFFNFSQASCIFGRIDIKWVALLAWQSSCADTSPKLEVSTPCLKTKKKPGGCHTKKTNDIFQPSFSKPKYELFRPGQSWVLQRSPPRKV